MSKNKNVEFILLFILTIVSGILFFKDIGKTFTIIDAGCNITEYFNCSKAQINEWSHILNIPISYFGFIFSGIMLFLVTYPKDFKSYNSSFIYISINAIISLTLFLYSVLELDSLCPYCLIYQLVSVILLFVQLFRKDYVFSLNKCIKIGLTILTLAIIPLIYNQYFNKSNASEIKTKKEKLIISILTKKVKVGEPLTDKSSWLIKSTDNFLDASIRISIFSDFQCPACRILSDNFKKSLTKYKDKINLQYINYPLDSSCNKNVYVPLHPESCLMSKIFLCSKDKEETHKYLFSIQEKVSNELLNKYIDKQDLEDCINSSVTDIKLKQEIQQGVYLDVESTPTIIINGLKFDGLIKPEFLDMILNYFYKN
jgi:protein-disulfide isomerase/uncharacterized membrane protein